VRRPSGFPLHDRGSAAKAVQAGSLKRSRRSFNMLVPTLARVVPSGLFSISRRPLPTIPKSMSPSTSERRRRHRMRCRAVPICLWSISTEPGAPRPADLAAQLVARGNPLIFTHLIKRQHLEQLWQAGIATCPSFTIRRRDGRGAERNTTTRTCRSSSRAADSSGPRSRRAAVRRAFLTIRHEISVPREPADLSAGRKRIRGGWGIGDETLVIGMIGSVQESESLHAGGSRPPRVCGSICQPNS